MVFIQLVSHCHLEASKYRMIQNLTTFQFRSNQQNPYGNGPGNYTRPNLTQISNLYQPLGSVLSRRHTLHSPCTDFSSLSSALTRCQPPLSSPPTVHFIPAFHSN